MRPANLQSGRVNWIGNCRLPILSRRPPGTRANRRLRGGIQRVAFTRKSDIIFINLNETLTNIGIILLKKRPRRVHVGVAKQHRRISALDLLLGLLLGGVITNVAHGRLTTGEWPWRSSL